MNVIGNIDNVVYEHPISDNTSRELRLIRLVHQTLIANLVKEQIRKTDTNEDSFAVEMFV